MANAGVWGFVQVAELNEATKLMAEKIESSNSRSLRTLATEDLSAKNLLSQVNSIRLKVRAASWSPSAPRHVPERFVYFDSPRVSLRVWRPRAWKDT